MRFTLTRTEKIIAAITFAAIVIGLLMARGVEAQGVTSYRNIQGGENFYSSDGQFLGYTTRNIGGGRNFFPNQAAQHSAPTGGYGYGQGRGWYGYHGSGDPTLQQGYAIGSGLSQFINAFRGSK